MYIKRYTMLFVIASIAMLVIFAFTPEIAFADSGDNSQVHTVSSFMPLGDSQVVNDPYDSSGSYSPHDGLNSNSPQDYWNPYNPNSLFNYGSPNFGNPYPTNTSTSIDPNNAPQQQDTGRHYGGNGLPFSGYSNSGNSPLHVQ